MKSVFTVSTALFLYVNCWVATAQENPFAAFAGKPYATYFLELETLLYRDIEYRDEVWLSQTAAQLRDVAKISKDKKWALEADYLETVYRFFRTRELLPNRTETQTDSLAAIYTADLQKIVRQANRIKAPDIELRALYNLWKCYYDHTKDFEMSFRYCRELDKVLTNVSIETFPMRTYYYTQLGNQYYSFQSYETARLYYEKGLDAPLNTFTQFELIPLWNNLGLIYRNQLNDLETSDSFFHKIITSKTIMPELPTGGVNPFNREIFTNQDNYELWAGIAQGNLGSNYYQRGDYENAVPLLIYGMEKTVENDNPHNFPYAAGKALILSEIYLETPDFHLAGLYADKAFGFLDANMKRDAILNPTKDARLWMQYYDLMSRFYRMTNDPVKALQYADSSAVARTRYEDDYNLRKLHYTELYAKQQELDAEMERNKIYFRNLVLISAFALLMLVLLTLLYRLYRQKQAAYRILVHKSQAWAQAKNDYATYYQEKKQAIHTPSIENELTPKANRDTPTETDFAVMQAIEQLITEQKIFKDISLSVDSLALLIGVHKRIISNAINRCAEKNFNTYINEYRVKEAILLLSGKDSQKFTFDGIAKSTGFNDRRNFLRIFKKMTGLTPRAFLSNLT